jgi:hypothetical protein
MMDAAGTRGVKKVCTFRERCFPAFLFFYYALTFFEEGLREKDEDTHTYINAQTWTKSTKIPTSVF